MSDWMVIATTVVTGFLIRMFVFQRRGNAGPIDRSPIACTLGWAR